MLENFRRERPQDIPFQLSLQNVIPRSGTGCDDDDDDDNYLCRIVWAHLFSSK